MPARGLRNADLSRLTGMHGVTGTRVIDTPNPNHRLTLHGYQADLVLNRTARVLVLQGGQGCGKTKALLVFLFLRIL